VEADILISRINGYQFYFESWQLMLLVRWFVSLIIFQVWENELAYLGPVGIDADSNSESEKSCSI